MSTTSVKKVSVDSGTIVRVLAFLLLALLLYVLRDILLIFLASVVIASAIEPATTRFEKMKIPRMLSVIGLYVSTAIVIVGSFYFFAPPLVQDLSGVVSRAPEYIESIKLWETNSTFLDNQVFNSFSNNEISITQLTGSLQKSVEGIGGGALGFFSGVFGGLFSFILIVVLSFYLAVQKDGIAEFLRVVIPFQHEGYAIDLWRRSQRKMGRWLQGQFVLGLIVGVLVYLGLTILGVKSALLLAILAAMLEIIPLFGPIIAAIPAIAIALVDGGVSLGLMVIGLYVIIQQFENHLIYPLVVKKVVGVPPLVVIVALIIGGQLAGFLGVLLAVPVVAALMEYANDVQKRKIKMHEEMDKKKTA